MSRVRHYVRARRTEALAMCDEAQRQLTMGRALDPAHAIAPVVPVLESIFDDAKLYEGHSWTSTRFPFVTPESKFAQSPAEIKGCNALATAQLFSRRLLGRCGTSLHKKGLASFYFFPPWHAVAQARKSRPALAVLRGPGSPFNGTAPAVKLARSSKSMNPLDFAVWRQRAARTYRRALLESYTVDGLYVAMVHKVPTLDEAREAVQAFTTKVAHADLQWAEKQARAIDLDDLDAQLARIHCMPTPRHVSRHEWHSTLTREK